MPTGEPPLELVSDGASLRLEDRRSGAEVQRGRGGGRGAPRPKLGGRSDRLRPKGFKACCEGRGAPRPPPPPKWSRAEQPSLPRESRLAVEEVDQGRDDDDEGADDAEQAVDLEAVGGP